MKLKVFAIVLSAIGFVVSLLSDKISEKQQEETIEQKIQEALAKREG